MKPKYVDRLPQFYYDDSEDSKGAKELLDQFGIKYDLRIQGVNVNLGDGSSDEDIVPPTIQSGEGWFQHLGGIKSYIELKCQLDKSL